jgi:hypothetical protein
MRMLCSSKQPHRLSAALPVRSTKHLGWQCAGCTNTQHAADVVACPSAVLGAHAVAGVHVRAADAVLLPVAPQGPAQGPRAALDRVQRVLGVCGSCRWALHHLYWKSAAECVIILFCSMPSTHTSARAGHAMHWVCIHLSPGCCACCGPALRGPVCHSAVGQLPRAGASGQLPHQRLGHGAV